MQEKVSVVIITYNSGVFVEETLESVKCQTYPYLELIVTDDCSEDNTVEICRKWLSENSQRFISYKIITSKKNTGVAANANRGLIAAHGEWIKFLGADDTLKAECIEDNMSMITSNQEIKVLFSQVEIYRDTFEPHNLIKRSPDFPYHSKSIFAPTRNAQSQYKMLLLCDRIHFTPSVFLHRETMLSLGGYDERFRLLEDYPLWLNLTKNGYKLYFMDKVTVCYRQHSNAINNTGKDYLINPNYFKNEDFRRLYTFPFLPADIRLNQQFYWLAAKLFRCDWLNNNKRPNRLLLVLLTTYLNPFRYFIWLRKKFDKSLKDNEFYV